MTLDVARLSSDLERREDGIWFARTRGSVSYPKGGNATCLDVEDVSFWFRHRNRCIVSVVRRFPPDGVLLDIGGGNGYVARGLIDAGISCALLEPGIDGAVAARTRGIDPVICGRLEDLNAASGVLSGIGMFDVIEHIEDESGTLRRIHSLLEPDGLLYLTVPAYGFLHSADDVAAGHFRRYTLRRLTRVLNNNGFRLLYATYFFVPLPPFVFLLRTLPSLMGLRRGHNVESATSDHVRGGFSMKVMDALLDNEAKKIDAGGSMRFGTSCLAVCTSLDFS